MTSFALLFTLSCIGIAETIHLIGLRRAIEERRKEGDVVHSNVLLSKYNALFLGVHNDVMGFLFYVASAVLTALLFLQTGPVMVIYAAEMAAITAAVFTSLVFVFLMWRVIRYWCVWCLMSAIITFVMGFIAFTAELVPRVI